MAIVVDGGYGYGLMTPGVTGDDADEAERGDEVPLIVFL